jgi:hypothetical protein
LRGWDGGGDGKWGRTNPPAHVHFVCHFIVEPLRLSRVVHWEPEVASACPQRFYFHQISTMYFH